MSTSRSNELTAVSFAKRRGVRNIALPFRVGTSKGRANSPTLDTASVSAFSIYCTSRSNRAHCRELCETAGSSNPCLVASPWEASQDEADSPTKLRIPTRYPLFLFTVPRGRTRSLVSGKRAYLPKAYPAQPIIIELIFMFFSYSYIHSYIQNPKALYFHILHLLDISISSFSMNGNKNAKIYLQNEKNVI